MTSPPLVSGVEDSPGLRDQVDRVAALAGQDLSGEERTGDKDRPDPAHQLRSASCEEIIDNNNNNKNNNNNDQHLLLT